MIAFLTGVLTQKDVNQIIVDVNGVGYQLEVSLTTLSQMPMIGQEIKIHTQLIVREDAQYLYGFFETDEKSMFQSLIKVSGIGAKVALTVLSHLSVSDIVKAISSANTNLLVKTPGIGKKTAERLVLELKDKLMAFDSLANLTITGSMHINTNQKQAIAALESLGYKPKEAADKIRPIDPSTKVDEMIKLALKQ